MKRFLPLLLIILTVSACIKEEIILDDQIHVDGMDPSFALPLGIVTMNLGDIEESQDIDNLSQLDDGLYALTFTKKLFEYSYGEILDIPAQSTTESLETDAAMALAINSLSTGSSIDFPMDTEIDFNYTNGEDITSINVAEGFLNISYNSELSQNITVNMNFPTINDGNNNPLTYIHTINSLDPMPLEFNHSLAGHEITFDLNGNVPVEITATVTKTNETVNAGDALDIVMEMSVEEIESVFGYFGQYTDVAAEGTQTVKLFPNLNESSVVFGDPRINLTLVNSAGMDVELNFDNVEFQTTSGNSNLTGPDLNNFPIITGASSPGDSSITLHTIDNTGVSPDLGSSLDLSNTDIVYSASVTTNPNGITNNFLLDTSKIVCNAEIIVPLFLGADNFLFTDTIEVDMAEILNVDEGDPNTVDVNDIDKVTVRMLVDNGFPLDIGAKIYFANEQDVILDSLWVQNDYQYIFESAQVDFSSPNSNPNYGRVSNSTASFTDFTLTSQKLQNLVDAGSKKLIINALGNTTDAASSELVKIYPEYEISVKVSAKIDFNIEVN